MKKKKLEGLVAATYTPMRASGGLHLEVIPAMVEIMIAGGVSGFYVCGSTGEGESLSVEERKAVAREFIDATAGRVPVVVQVGSNALPNSRELAGHAAEIGADAISALPPTYFRPATLDRLLDGIVEITSAAPDLPFYYYHIPRLSGVAFDMVELLRLGSERIPSLAGIKFSDFFLADYTACLGFSGNQFEILFGSDEMLLGALASGARGAVGSCYGFAPRLWLNLWEAYDAGKEEEARAWMAQGVDLVQRLARPGPFHAVVKQAVWPLLGVDAGPVRWPQTALDPPGVDEARRWLDQSGFGEAIATGNFLLP